MKKVIAMLVSVVIGILVYNKNEEIIIPSDAIRIRIIANSNNIKDLYEKKKVKEEIKDDIYNLVINAKSNIEADSIIKDKIDYIRNIVSKKTNDFTINYGINHFPNKKYKGVLYPEGDYKSLVISLGSGQGDNWWCVLYPPLCLIDDKETSDVEYRLFVSDILSS